MGEYETMILTLDIPDDEVNNLCQEFMIKHQMGNTTSHSAIDRYLARTVLEVKETMKKSNNSKKSI